VLPKLDGEALVRRGVETCGEAFNNSAGEELEVLKTGDVLRVQDVRKRGHGRTRSRNESVGLSG
jgi:hypothetical protein